MSRPLGSLIVLRSQRVFAIVASACLVLWLGVLGVASDQAAPASRSNIVLMFPDNLGWDEVNVYGGVRGAKEETDIKDANPWLQSVTDRILNEFNATIQRYPHVPPNAPDPYSPPKV